MKYYYFIDGKTYIAVTDTKVDTTINPNFKQLTKKQRDFYIENPDATVDEIRNCQRYEPPTPVVRPIEEVRADAENTISDFSLTTMARFCTAYQFANAQSSLIEIEAGNEPIYDSEKAHRYIATYGRIGKICRNYFYEAKTAIESTDSEEEINNIISQYENIYQSITDADL